MDLSKSLKTEEKKRKKILEETVKNMDGYSEYLLLKNKNIEHYKIEEIKYKTTINELNDYIKIYKEKLDKLEDANKNDIDEVMKLRKKVLNDKTEISSLKSMIELIVKEYGINKISEITKIEKNKIEEIIKDDNTKIANMLDENLPNK